MQYHRIIKSTCIAIILIFASFSFVSPNFQGKSSDPTFFLGGQHIDEPDFGQYANLVKDIGMNTIEVTHYALHGEWDSDYLYIHESKKETIEQIQIAKSKGLYVVLILRVHLMESFQRNKFLWHGMIMPKSEQALDKWFSRYKEYVLDWAKICEKEGVDVLVIGSELNALSATIQLDRLPELYEYFNDKKAQLNEENRLLQFENELAKTQMWIKAKNEYPTLENYIEEKIEAQYQWSYQFSMQGESKILTSMNLRRNRIEQYWREIIQICRKEYSGKMGYAANFDNYKEVGFWDELDMIGINAYCPLSTENSSCHDIRCVEKFCYKSWRKILKGIQKFRQNKGLEEKIVMFTELGYVNRKHATVEPWKGFGYSIMDGFFKDKLLIWEEQEINNLERIGAVQGLHRAVKKENFPLKGILYWKLTRNAANLTKEPFGLQLQDPAIDELQSALLEFVNQ